MQTARFASLQGCRVLVTGHTGFKGGWLTVWLKQLGARVAGFALPAQSPSFYERTAVREGVQEYLADLRDRDAVAAAVSESQPELIIHMAAQPLVRKSYREPVETFAANIMGTVHVLEAARATSSVRAIVVITSDKCYENREWIWPYREYEALGGHDPYSASKGCAEIVTASYRHSYFSQPGSPLLASCRAGNVFGGGDWAEDRLVPDIARAIRSDQPVVIRNPKSIRPWQHVLEPLRGYLTVADRLLAGKTEIATAWNFGPAQDSEVPVSDLASRMIARWGKGRIEIHNAEAALHEARLLRLDSSKAAVELGWRPVLNMNDSVAYTVDWYRQDQDNPETVQALTVAQIEDYQRRCEGRDVS